MKICSPVSSCVRLGYLFVEGVLFVLDDVREGRHVLVVEPVVRLLRQEDLLQLLQVLAVRDRLGDLLRLQGQTRLEKFDEVQSAEPL